MNTKALIIVDMLNDFIRPQGALYCGESAQAIVPFIRDRLTAARQAGEVVIYLQDAHAPDDEEFKRFPPHCVAGTWGSQIIDELAPRPGEPVLPKSRYSGFFGTNLDKILAEINPQEVEVVGVCTSICVMDTVGGLANRNYRVRVPQQGVADFDDAFHRFALQRMQRLYGATIA
ncbi:MAG: cysteine hydrolase [Desulfobacteraceae bacterium]|nr:cysteine hydrolase [Desulfobacteraceae bacterium]